MPIRQWQIVLLWFALVGLALAQERTVRLEDSSDWWSRIRQEEDSLREPLDFQKRVPAETNFQIVGIALGTPGGFQKNRSTFGVTTEIERGDAASGRHQLCYVSPSGGMHLIFEFGEVESVVYLFEDRPNWNGSELCARSTVLATNISTASGLRLGLDPQQVRVILGNPSIATSDNLIYYFEFKNKTSAEGLVRLRKDNPNMSEAEFHKNFDYLEVEAYIEARFVSGKLNYLAISRSEVY